MNAKAKPSSKKAPKSAMAIQAAADLYAQTNLGSLSEYLAEHWETSTEEEIYDLLNKFYGAGEYEGGDCPCDDLYDKFVEEHLNNYTDDEVKQVFKSAHALLDDVDYVDAHYKVTIA